MEYLGRLRLDMQRWLHRALCLGGLLATDVLFVVPFLEGHRWHSRFDQIGKYLIVLAMILLLGFGLAAAFTYSCWAVLRMAKKDGFNQP